MYLATGNSNAALLAFVRTIIWSGELDLGIILILSFFGLQCRQWFKNNKRLIFFSSINLFVNNTLSSFYN